MVYKVRSSADILKALTSRVVARSDLADIAEGSVIMHILASAAEEINNVELRLKTIRDSYSFDNLVGTDLDERVAELPPEGLTRLGETAAAGSVLTLTRDSTDIAAELVVPEGSLFSRSDDSSLTYSTTAEITFEAGSASVSDVPVACSITGTIGNAPQGIIDVVEMAPDAVTGVVQTTTLTNGSDEETDVRLKQRAIAYLGSLARCQPNALEYAALSFISEAGVRMQYAKLAEDPERPGYSRLVVDDGADAPSVDEHPSQQQGQTSRGLTPKAGQSVIWHERPATQPIEVVNIYGSDGGFTKSLKAVDGDFVSVPERGLVYLKKPLTQSDEYQWAILGETYKIFTGAIAELQEVIEGDTSSPVDFPGFRAAGTRVRVIPATALFTQFVVHVVPVSKITIKDVSAEVRQDIIEYCRSLGPGEPLYIARLYDILLDNRNLLNIHIYDATEIPYAAKEDVYPQKFASVRTTENLIAVVAKPEGG
jgi:uncharacterized phage protein gp47/JayE